VTPPSNSGTTGGVVGGTTAGMAGGTTAGTSAPPTRDAGAPPTGGLIGGTGGLIGGAGSSDAGASLDSGTVANPADASLPVDGALPDGGVPDGALPDGGIPDAASDSGCLAPSTPDASVCPGYGCKTTLQQLSALMDQEGACSSAAALAVACDGRVTNAALQCTQENVFSLNIDRSVNACLKRDAQLAAIGDDCLDCFVDEALCVLTRCFSACTINSTGNACQICRRQQCSAQLSVCTGLPSP
jgi:hypothetical protein